MILKVIIILEYPEEYFQAFILPMFKVFTDDKHGAHASLVIYGYVIH